MSAPYNRKDHLYHKAKNEGMRSRAAYKLQELNDKYGLIEAGDYVLDLGCWPGGWLQTASQLVRGSGLVVGIDLVEIEPLAEPNVRFVCGDVCEDANVRRLLELAEGRFDVVLSDMSAKLTGIREADDAAAGSIADLALSAARQTLEVEGNFVVKLFKGNEAERFVKTARPLFNKLIRTELKSSRSTSNEFYAIGLGFKG